MVNYIIMDIFDANANDDRDVLLIHPENEPNDICIFIESVKINQNI